MFRRLDTDKCHRVELEKVPVDLDNLLQRLHVVQAFRETACETRLVAMSF